MGAKTKIDWADATWNPVTGCLHECEYCYARRQAERFGGFDNDENKEPVGTLFAIGVQELDNPKYIMRSNGLQKAPYPWFFAPTFHRYRLDEPRRWTKPRNIFVCSMADLFGEWVPDEWIHEVFKACEAAPQHRYLFLTKNPGRYTKLRKAGMLPTKENMWYGSTTPTIDATYAIGKNAFVSVEPMLAPFDCMTEAPLVGWAIIGAETGNRREKVVPKKAWVDDYVCHCKEWGIPVFMKESLRPIMGDDFIQQFPWEV